MNEEKQETITIGNVELTNRGFEIVKFKDYYDMSCSLQMSSICIDSSPGLSAIWIGLDDADPKIMARDAKAHGVTLDENVEVIDGTPCGWVPYPIPDAVSLSTRMHLDRDQVESLILSLQNWLTHGSFDGEE